ncbi:MAG: YHS domain-containing (seleno)protein [Smithella sp.]
MISMKFKHGILVGIILLILLLAGGSFVVYGLSSMNASAIKGYDPLAYFKEGKAVKGNEAYSYPWHDKMWQFSSRENRDQFSADPEKYAPQYDGYCAWAMTQARKAETDPEMWKIYNGKLYLNCNRSAYEKWKKDIPGNIKKADANWKKLYSKSTLDLKSE